MSLEHFLEKKEELFSDPALVRALAIITPHVRQPVLTLRTVVELGRVLGGPNNAGTYEKRLASVVIPVPEELSEDPAVAQLNLRKVYQAESALAYLASLARQQHPEYSDAVLQSHFTPATFFRELMHHTP